MTLRERLAWAEDVVLNTALPMVAVLALSALFFFLPSTEAAVDVDLLVSLVALATALLTGGRMLFRTEASMEFLAKAVEQHSGKLAALDIIITEVRTSHVGLAERVAGLGAVVGEKASVESVESVRDSVDSLRRELGAQLDRIERKLDGDDRPGRK